MSLFPFSFSSETADERAEEILGALYDYAESIAPDRY
jgi:exodeoxyribonuclease-1